MVFVLVIMMMMMTISFVSGFSLNNNNNDLLQKGSRSRSSNNNGIARYFDNSNNNKNNYHHHRIINNNDIFISNNNKRQQQGKPSSSTTLLLLQKSPSLSSSPSMSLSSLSPAVTSTLFRKKQTSNNSLIQEKLKQQQKLSMTSSSAAAAASVPLSTTKTTTTTSIIKDPNNNNNNDIIINNEIHSKFISMLVKVGMILYIIGMCILLPITLLPLGILEKFNIINKLQRERYSLKIGQLCSRILLKLIPFCNIKTFVDKSFTQEGNNNNKEIPSIWVCNHTSMLDIFILLGCDHMIRPGKYNRRPIKIVYWKQLENNIITKLLFKFCGFISVDMVANNAGEDNIYDVKTFKQLLKDVKLAFNDGYDVGILPEGQLNPCPENGLLPIYAGAYTLSKMSKRPIQMISLYGIHKLWHPIIGMNPYGRNIKIRVYPKSYKTSKDQYTNSDEFIYNFKNIVGYFGSTGNDIPDLNKYIDGTKYKQHIIKEQEKEEEKAKKEEEKAKKEKEEKAKKEIEEVEAIKSTTSSSSSITTTSIPPTKVNEEESSIATMTTTTATTTTTTTTSDDPIDIRFQEHDRLFKIWKANEERKYIVKE